MPCPDKQEAELLDGFNADGCRLIGRKFCTMYFDGIRKPNTLYVADVSRGKDSTAMLRAIRLMNWPLDAVISVDLWATKDIPAELPPMVAFKDEWDEKCLKNFGIPVTRVCARKKCSQSCNVEREPSDESDKYHSQNSYEDMFYTKLKSGKFVGNIKGFPQTIGGWCKKLKYEQVDIRGCILQSLYSKFLDKPVGDGQKINIIHYIGIAADEPNRIKRHIEKPDEVLPLVQIGWDESLCGLEATYFDMLAPTYTSSMRDGCWFCHNQGVDQLRSLRHNYPDLWALLMKWDTDSPVTFHADGHTVHDYDRRFQMEDEGKVKPEDRWKWSYLECLPSQFKTFDGQFFDVENLSFTKGG